QLLHSFLNSFALIAEQQFRALAAERLRDRISQAPLVGDAEYECGLSFEQLRHDFPVYRTGGGAPLAFGAGLLLLADGDRFGAFARFVAAGRSSEHALAAWQRNLARVAGVGAVLGQRAVDRDRIAGFEVSLAPSIADQAVGCAAFALPFADGALLVFGVQIN